MMVSHNIFMLKVQVWILTPPQKKGKEIEQGGGDSIKKACRVNYVLVVMLGRSTSYPKVRNPPTETSDLLSRFIIISQKMERNQGGRKAGVGEGEWE